MWWHDIFNFWQRRKRLEVLDPDEIFLDSGNLPSFDTNQLEGKLEKPISKGILTGSFVFFLVAGLLFMGRIGFIQVVEGEELRTRSNQNKLRYTLVFADRGVIYDRNNKSLAWNNPSREYITDPGFAHVLGYIGLPNKIELESADFNHQEYIGKNGVENTFNDILMGQRGIKIEETDASGNTESDHVLQNPEPGKSINLSIDARIQTKLFSIIQNVARDNDFAGGAAAIMDIHTGEVISLISYPEYDPNILAQGKDRTSINQFINNPDKPFLNRVISGLYTPGSIVKPFVALAALHENLISPNKVIYTDGTLVIPNRYFPDKPTTYRDWKNLGPVDMREALAMSSNIYFFHIGGGYNNQPGLGITKINTYSHLFGLGEKTNIELNNESVGVIPNPEWKKKNYEDGDWRLGDTFLTSIGQYGYLITPIEMLRSVAFIANNGLLIEPTLLAKPKEPEIVRQSDIDRKHFKVVQEGMRQVVTNGTGGVLNTPHVKVAAKSGTAEIDATKNRVNAWITGFFPYDNPRYSFVVVLESGRYGGSAGGGVVMRQLFDWMAYETPEYFE